MGKEIADANSARKRCDSIANRPEVTKNNPIQQTIYQGIIGEKSGTTQSPSQGLIGHREPMTFVMQMPLSC